MIEFKLQDMTCGHCEKVVRQTVSELDPQAKVDVDLPSHTVKIDGQAAREQLAHALEEAGYPPSP